MKQPFWKLKHDFLCLKIIAMLYDENCTKSRIYNEIRSLMDFTNLENIRKYDIIEKRYNDGSHYTKDEHGRFTGSTSSGGGSSSGGGKSSGSGMSVGNLDEPEKERFNEMTEEEPKEVIQKGINAPQPVFSYDTSVNNAMSRLAKTPPRKSSFSKRKIKLCHPERKRRIFVTKVSRRQRFFVASLLRMTNRDAYILKIDFRETPPVPDTFDVKAHGSEASIEFFKQDYLEGDKRRKIDAFTLSCILKGRNDYQTFVADCKSRNVTPTVRLLSCNTGNTTNTGNCFAQLLASELGHNVVAPTKTLYVFDNGSFQVGKYADGEMKIFFSRKN